MLISDYTHEPQPVLAQHQRRRPQSRERDCISFVPTAWSSAVINLRLGFVYAAADPVYISLRRTPSPTKLKAKGFIPVFAVTANESSRAEVDRITDRSTLIPAGADRRVAREESLYSCSRHNVRFTRDSIAIAVDAHAVRGQKHQFLPRCFHISHLFS